MQHILTDLLLQFHVLPFQFIQLRSQTNNFRVSLAHASLQLHGQLLLLLNSGGHITMVHWISPFVHADIQILQPGSFLKLRCKTLISDHNLFRIIWHKSLLKLNIIHFEARNRVQKPLDKRFLAANGGAFRDTLMVGHLMRMDFQECTVFAALPGGAAVGLELLADGRRDADGAHLADVRDAPQQ
uniref:Uncharacterized protein n=1 Tax=Oryza brachyantha TaxID=4533 RepID=J3L5C7_ORYBR